jgi:hypothetical protein
MIEPIQRHPEPPVLHRRANDHGPAALPGVESLPQPVDDVAAIRAHRRP